MTFTQGQVLRHVQTGFLIKVIVVGEKVTKVLPIDPNVETKKYIELRTARMYRSWKIDEIATVLYGNNAK